MARRRKQTAGERAHPLNDREAAVLEALILDYVREGEPVASTRLAARSDLDLSSASIRSVMARLEEAGYLDQPHTSAGRVPTDRAYRLYVDHLMRTPRLSTDHSRSIREALDASRGEIGDLLETASRQLAQFTRQVGVVLAPRLTEIIVERLEFVRLDPRRIVAVVIARSGVVHHRVIRVEQAPGQADLDRDGAYLSEQFGGLVLAEIRRRLIDALERERAALDVRLLRCFQLGQQALDGPDDGALVFVDGASNLLESRDLADHGDLREILRTLEEREQLVGLLDRLIGQEGVQVAIGGELAAEHLSRCAVVASPYGTGDRTLGTIGVVGPTRMEYPRAVTLVRHLSSAIGRYLGEDGGEDGGETG